MSRVTVLPEKWKRTVGRKGQASKVSEILTQSSSVSVFTRRSSSTTPCLISSGTRLPAPGAMELSGDGVSEAFGSKDEARSAIDLREGLAPRRRLADKHVPRHVLERVIALDERLRARRHLDRARLTRVVSRSVEVVVRRQELRQDLGLLDFGERVEENRELVVMRVARLGKQFLQGRASISACATADPMQLGHSHSTADSGPGSPSASVRAGSTTSDPRSLPRAGQTAVAQRRCSGAGRRRRNSGGLHDHSDSVSSWQHTQPSYSQRTFVETDCRHVAQQTLLLGVAVRLPGERIPIEHSYPVAVLFFESLCSRAGVRNTPDLERGIELEAWT